MSDQPGWQQQQPQPPPPPYGQPPNYGQPPPLYAPQFGPAPQGQPQYGVPVYAPPRNSGTAIAALVVAILSFTTCPLIGGIIALILANNAKREILLSGGSVTGESMVTAARVLSWINIGVSIAAIVFGLVIFIIALVAGEPTSTAMTFR